jgi:hypothetical protein
MGRFGNESALFRVLRECLCSEWKVIVVSIEGCLYKLSNTCALFLDFFFFLFWQHRVRTQGLILDRHYFNHSTSSVILCVGFFQDRFSHTIFETS